MKVSSMPMGKATSTETTIVQPSTANPWPMWLPPMDVIAW